MLRISPDDRVLGTLWEGGGRGGGEGGREGGREGRGGEGRGGEGGNTMSVLNTTHSHNLYFCRGDDTDTVTKNTL